MRGWWCVVGLVVACGSRKEPRDLEVSTGAPRASPLGKKQLAAPDPASAIGTAHPFLAIVVAENGRWIVGCQAREETDGRPGISVDVGHHGQLSGDRMRPFLFRGGGAGDPIDAFVTASVDERWIAVVRDRRFVLIDDAEHVEIEVPDVDVEPDREGYGRIATFDGRDRYLAFFRVVAGKRRVVVRELATGSEREVTFAGDVLPWRFQRERDSHWVRVLVVSEDSDGNGKLEWPSVGTNAPVAAVCAGEFVSYSEFGRRGDVPQAMWIDLASGRVVQGTNVLAHIGDAEVRARDGAVYIGDDEVVPAKCKAAVVAVILDPRRVVARCDDAEVLTLFGGSAPVELDGASAPRGELPEPRVMRARVLCSNPETCFAAADGKRLKLHGSMVDQAGTKLLLKRGEGFVMFDAGTGAEKAVPGATGYVRARAKDLRVVDNVVIDLANARVVGKLAHPPLGIDARGRGLLAEREAAQGVATGPVRWVAPE
ncbi:MAG: hypothetical protein KF773_35635 [Deltaproteobacteria bacterium]|nr:hypothetical protein [Deltaproteobacteria bacterium]